MAKTNSKKEKPLTLTDLVNYNQEVLFPYLGENFITKKYLDKKLDEKLDKKLDEKLGALTKLDDIVGKLDKLIEEKEVGKYQDKKQKTILEIHNKSLERGKVLTPAESSQIAKLEFF